jgi:hypothetical protein
LDNFLSISPNQNKFFPSVCLVPAGLFCCYRFSLCGVFKKVINLAIARFVSSVFEENISVAEFGMISAETACWDIKRK